MGFKRFLKWTPPLASKGLRCSPTQALSLDAVLSLPASVALGGCHSRKKQQQKTQKHSNVCLQIKWIGSPIGWRENETENTHKKARQTAHAGDLHEEQKNGQTQRSNGWLWALASLSHGQRWYQTLTQLQLQVPPSLALATPVAASAVGSPATANPRPGGRMMDTCRLFCNLFCLVCFFFWGCLQNRLLSMARGANLLLTSILPFWLVGHRLGVGKDKSFLGA